MLSCAVVCCRVVVSLAVPCCRLLSLAVQAVEMQVRKIEVLGECEARDYPMGGKKMHTLEHLRAHQNLRMRTNIVSSGAVIVSRTVCY